MPYSREELRRIYDRTGGRCHICGKMLALTNYAQPGERGAWHVEHSVPRAKGGTEHGNNLYAACIDCNREKGTLGTRAARARLERSRAPMSKTARREARQTNTIGGAVIGALLGATGGPLGMAAGAAIGGAIGKSIKPDD